MHKISEAKRREVIYYLSQGLSIREIARKLHVGFGTVQNLKQKLFPTSRKLKGGRPKKLNKRQKKNLCSLYNIKKSNNSF